MSNNTSLVGRIADGNGQSDLRSYVSIGTISFDDLNAELQSAIRLAETALQSSSIENVIMPALQNAGFCVDTTEQGYVHTDNNFTTEYKNILDNFDPGGGGFVQVQVDWNEADSESIKYIKNKPTIPAAQVQSDWNVSDVTSKAYILHKPTIPDAQVQSNWNEVDTSSKAYILNKPTIPDVSGLAPLASPSFTGTPTAPTATQGTDTQQIATTEFVNAAVSAGVGKGIGNVVVLTGSSTIEHSDISGIPPLYVIDCDNDPSNDVEATLTGLFEDGDSFYFVVKYSALGNDGYIKSVSSDLHEPGSSIGVSYIQVSTMFMEYTLIQCVYTPIGWIMK